MIDNKKSFNNNSSIVFDNNDKSIKEYLEKFSFTNTKHVLTQDEELSMRKLFLNKIEHFDIIQELSRGAYKKTIQLRNPKTSESLAVKIVELNKLTGRAKKHLMMVGYKNVHDAFEDEARRMKQLNNLRNTHLSKIQGSGLNEGKSLYFFLEDYSERTLMDYVIENHPLSIKLIENIIYQLADGLSAIHKYYCHGDLKLDNILFRNCLMCITDFGLAASMPDAESSTKNLIPHAQIRAPETFHNLKIDKRCDIWAFGINSYYISHKKWPFPLDYNGNILEWRNLSINERKKYELNVLKYINNNDHYINILNNIEKFFRPKISSILKQCLNREPNKRFQDGFELLNMLRTEKSLVK